MEVAPYCTKKTAVISIITAVSLSKKLSYAGLFLFYVV